MKVPDKNTHEHISTYSYTYVIGRQSGDMKELLDGHPNIFFALLYKEYIKTGCKLFDRKEEAVQAAKLDFEKSDFSNHKEKYPSAYWIVKINGDKEELLNIWPESQDELIQFINRILSVEDSTGHQFTREDFN